MKTRAQQTWKELEAEKIRQAPKLFLVIAGRQRTPRGTYISKPGKGKKGSTSGKFNRKCQRCRKPISTDSPFIRRCKHCKAWAEKHGCGIDE